jgi:hypothetical protein
VQTATTGQPRRADNEEPVRDRTEQNLTRGNSETQRSLQTGNLGTTKGKILKERCEDTPQQTETTTKQGRLPYSEAMQHTNSNTGKEKEISSRTETSVHGHPGFALKSNRVLNEAS